MSSLKNPLKVKSLRGVISALKKDRKKRNKVVFTNGCFDILHVGHVRYLKQARSLGDRLVIGLNTDDSVKSLKGAGRPVVSEKERAEVLSALDCVDYIVLFSDPTPLRVIRALRPDFLVKGGDWTKENIVGSNFVQSYGGKVKPLPFVKGFSSTRLIQKIRKLG